MNKTGSESQRNEERRAHGVFSTQVMTPLFFQQTQHGQIWVGLFSRREFLVTCSTFWHYLRRCKPCNCVYLQPKMQESTVSYFEIHRMLRASQFLFGASRHYTD